MYIFAMVGGASSVAVTSFPCFRRISPDSRNRVIRAGFTARDTGSHNRVHIWRYTAVIVTDGNIVNNGMVSTWWAINWHFDVLHIGDRRRQVETFAIMGVAQELVPLAHSGGRFVALTSVVPISIHHAASGVASTARAIDKVVVVCKGTRFVTQAIVN